MSTATRSCRICNKPIEENSWRSVVFGGEHICQDCYYELKPRYSPIEIAGVKGFTLYPKTEKLNRVLRRFLKGNDAKMGPVLFSYAAKIFFIRYHGYTIVPLIEKDFDGDFVPAKEIFEPFHFRVVDPFLEEIEEVGDKVKVTLKLKKGVEVGKQVILFQTSPNPKDVETAVRLLREKGVKSLLCFFLTEA